MKVSYEEEKEPAKRSQTKQKNANLASNKHSQTQLNALDKNQAPKPVTSGQATLESINSWRALGKLSEHHRDFYYQLYQNKLTRRQIQDIPERRKHKLMIDGYTVWLPFDKPYNCQRDYIAKVIEAMRTGSNAMLESPTGTGKTISFLCAAVAFIKQQREKNPGLSDLEKHTIIYCTRTHSQIKQVIGEIKTKLPYKVAVQTLAAKQQLCIMEDVKDNLKGQMLDHKCKKLRHSRRVQQSGGDNLMDGASWMEQEMQAQQLQSKSSSEGCAKASFATNFKSGHSLVPNSSQEMHTACPFYLGDEMSISHFPKSSEAFRYKKFNPIIDMVDERIHESLKLQNGGTNPQQCLDIEDLLETGKQHNLCPYYLAKSRLPGADIVVLPYTYLLTTHLRRQLQLNLKNSIILFDEAHNIDKNCEDVLSFDIQVEHFWEAFRLLDKTSNPKESDNFDEYSRRKKATHLKCFLMRFYNAIRNIDLKKQNNALGQVQRCVTGVFVVELEEFLAIFDKLLMDSGDSYDYVYVSDEEDDGGHLNLNRPIAADPSNTDIGNAITSRNFQKKGGHKLNESALSDHEGLDSPNQAKSPHTGIQVTKNGQKYIRYQKREEDVKYEELNKLIESAYACFDNSYNTNADCDAADQDMQVAQEGEVQAAEQEGSSFQVPPTETAPDRQPPGSLDRSKLSFIIEMLEKINKVKRMIQRASRNSSMSQDQSALSLKDFKFFIRTNKGTKGQEKQHITQWGIYCLSPSYIFKHITKHPEEKPLSVMLTSGTLQPMKILYQELKTQFKVKLVNEHFIDNSQVFATIIQNDMQGKQFKFNFENQNMLRSFRQLGLLLSRLTKCIQGGILLFFTSYTHIQQCYKEWTQSRFDFNGARLFQERSKDAWQSEYEEYKDAIYRTNKGIMMCVSRGKLSEGLNFADNLARACFVVGIPYLLVNDPKVNLKKKYLDQSNEQVAVTPDYSGDPTKSKSYQRINGDYWFKWTAIREVNQIIGRCIRHQNDYASIFLIDSRYEHKIHKDKLSQWVKDRLRKFDSYDALEEDLNTFYRQNELRQFQQQTGEILAEKKRKELQTLKPNTFKAFQEVAEEQQKESNPPLVAEQSKEESKEKEEEDAPGEVSSSSDELVVTAGMLGLDSSRSNKNEQSYQQNSYYSELLRALSSHKPDNDNFLPAEEGTFDAQQAELSSLIPNLMTIQTQNERPSKLNISTQELLSALDEGGESAPQHSQANLRNKEESNLAADASLSDFPRSELEAIIMMSQKAIEPETVQNQRGEDFSISIGEATLTALETKEQIQPSQLSIDLQELKDLCTSQMTEQDYPKRANATKPEANATQQQYKTVDVRPSVVLATVSEDSLAQMDPLTKLRRKGLGQKLANGEAFSDSSSTVRGKKRFAQFLKAQDGKKQELMEGNNALIYGNQGLFDQLEDFIPADPKSLKPQDDQSKDLPNLAGQKRKFNQSMGTRSQKQTSYQRDAKMTKRGR